MELINLIHKELPQIQCGRCDTPGCMQYAQAIVDGDPHDRCVPGGQETLDKLNSILDKKISKVNLDYGPTIDNQKVSIVESECIGCKKCIDACPVDAIVGSANMMHSIIDDLCTGCELCIEPCPVDCIEIVSVSNDEIKAPRDISQSAYDIPHCITVNCIVCGRLNKGKQKKRKGRDLIVVLIPRFATLHFDSIDSIDSIGSIGSFVVLVVL